MRRDKTAERLRGPDARNKWETVHTLSLSLTSEPSIGPQGLMGSHGCSIVAECIGFETGMLLFKQLSTGTSRRGLHGSPTSYPSLTPLTTEVISLSLRLISISMRVAQGIRGYHARIPTRFCSGWWHLS